MKPNANTNQVCAGFLCLSENRSRTGQGVVDNNHVKTGQIARDLSSLVESNRKVSIVANDRFQGGASSYLEVLDAERSLFNSVLELADARRDRLLSVVLALRALGGG